MLRLFIAINLIVAITSFQISSFKRYGKSSLKMVWAAKETTEKYLIAPSILSANFAKLGDEVFVALC
jgi:hypothetical protein